MFAAFIGEKTTRGAGEAHQPGFLDVIVRLGYFATQGSACGVTGIAEVHCASE